MASHAIEDERLLYVTQSMCIRCAIVDKRGFHWQHAQVVGRGRAVWIKLSCPRHGTQETLYCSDTSFFQQALSYSVTRGSAGWFARLRLGRGSPCVPDLENIAQSLQRVDSAHDNLPLIVELEVFVNDQFLSDEAVVAMLEKITARYPPGLQFVLKVAGKLAMDMTLLNAKMKFIEARIPSIPILLDLSFDRLMLICRLPESVLLSSHVYPSVKYYLKRGDEDQCMEEMIQLLETLQEFSNICLMITIVVDRPFPDLDGVLSLFRSHKGLVRVVVFSIERPPHEVIARATRPVDGCVNIDPFQLVELIEHASQGQISRDDFVPFAAGAALEPVLSMMGFGNYHIRPSPFCGFASLLVHTESYTGTPITRLIDAHKFFKEMMPHVPTMKPGVMAAKRIQKAVAKCTRSHVHLPDILSYFTDPHKSDIVHRTVQNAQLIVIHNNMDVTTLDAVRRCQCAVMVPSTMSPSGLGACCTSPL